MTITARWSRHVARRVSSGVAIVLAAALTALPALAQPTADSDSPTAAALYRLIDTPLLTSARWGGPQSSLRLEAAAGLAPRHELRLTSTASGAAPPPGDLASTLRLDAARATYRYTVVERNDWAWQVGLTANLREFGDGLRAGITSGERPRFGALPMVHMAGQGRLAERWRLHFDADGMLTARGRSVDLGLSVNYLLAPNMSFFGGYRLSEAAGEAEELNLPGLNNSANLGLRYRF